jgi:transcriptional regulator with XRE-family HTH domain
VAYNRFGLWLDRMITERELGSQSELARRLFTSHATVNRWMNGATLPDYNQVAAIARVLQVSRAEVLTELGVLPDLADPEFAAIVELWAAATEEERQTLATVGRSLIRRRLDDSL